MASTTYVPEKENITRSTTVIINKPFAAIAEACLPTIHSWIEEPLEVVTFTPDPSQWFQHRAEHRLTVEQLASFPLGKGDEVILDFGSHRVGYLSFHLGAVGVNVDAPTRLRLTFGEVPWDVAEDLSDVKTWISTSWLPDEVINVDWLPTDVELPRRYSFRYLKVQVLDTSEKYKCLLSSVRVRAVSAISPERFATVPSLNLTVDDPLLRQIDHISQVTLRDCMQTVFEDGPRRDRRLWIGDLRLMALTNYATFNDHTLAKRCLYMFAAAAADDGSIPACVYERPSLQASSDYIVDYDALFTTTLYEYVSATGDIDTGKELWPSALRSLQGVLNRHIDPATYAFDSQRSDLWNFLDWDRTLHPDAGMHGLMLYCCERADELAALLGIEPHFAPVVARMKDAARRVFLEERGPDAGAVFVSGPQKQVSWLSQAWLVLAGVLPPETNRRILLDVMRSADALRPLCPYGWATFAESLAVCGAREECVGLLKEYWGGMVRRGADTFWECYDPLDARKSPYGDARNNSYCHAWSTSPAWLLRSVLRIG